MNKESSKRLHHLCEYTGIAFDDAKALRRISMTLHRWFELECGNGYIERDEATNIPRYCRANSQYLDPKDPRAWTIIPDRETGARKRLAKIMASYPTLDYYVQTDSRGAARHSTFCGRAMCQRAN